jgi:hypothetical protein
LEASFLFGDALDVCGDVHGELLMVGLRMRMQATSPVPGWAHMRW